MAATMIQAVAKEPEFERFILADGRANGSRIAFICAMPPPPSLQKAASPISVNSGPAAFRQSSVESCPAHLGLRVIPQLARPGRIIVCWLQAPNGQPKSKQKQIDGQH